MSLLKALQKERRITKDRVSNIKFYLQKPHMATTLYTDFHLKEAEQRLSDLDTCIKALSQSKPANQ